MIRHAGIQDLTAIEAVYAHARKFMEETGNPNQWGKNHPPRTSLENAIAVRKLYVLEEDGAIHGSFYFAIEEEPNYRKIDDGSWLSDAPYGRDSYWWAMRRHHSWIFTADRGFL